MSDQAIKTLVSQGLAAMKAGSKVAEKATSEIQNDAKDAGLKAALEQGNQTASQWKQRIDQAAGEVGGVDEIDNKILQAHFEVSKEIRRKAQDDESRDLGIIASGQMALHYWIAAFGTMKSYAGKAGLSNVEQAMQTSVEEAKKADQAHTELAQTIMRQAA